MGFFDNNGFVDLLSNYLKTQFEIIKLDVQDAMEQLLSKLVKFFFAAFALSIAFLFILLAFAFLLNDYFESTYLGFLIMSLVSLVVASVFYALFKKENKPFNSSTDVPTTESVEVASHDETKGE